jgi:hypothetical protein
MAMDRTSRCDRVLALAFLAPIAAVPVAQTAAELARGGRVQFTDVFRYAPTSANLRRFERALEDSSCFQQALRPEMRRARFHALGDTGAQVVPGRDGWLFFRPDLRALLDPDRREPPRTETGAHGFTWVRPEGRLTAHQSVVRAVVRFRDQLRERGVHLLVVPAPGKPAIYPERLTRRAAGRESAVRSPSEEFLEALRGRGVETVDLFAAFRAARRGSPAEPLYLARDTHWTPRGA